MLQISDALISQIKSLGERSYPHECCGVLAGRSEESEKRVESLIPARNLRADSPANRFLISSGFVREVELKLRKTGRQIVGFFHSHPDAPARPSEYDREHAWPWYSYLIVSVRKGKADEARSWTLKEDRSAYDLEPIDVLGVSGKRTEASATGKSGLFAPAEE